MWILKKCVFWYVVLFVPGGSGECYHYNTTFTSGKNVDNPKNSKKMQKAVNLVNVGQNANHG